jgi:pilus assembly protein Flp/PilA
MDAVAADSGATMISSLRRFLTNDRGTTAIEYAIIAAGVSVAIAATVTATGTSVKQRYDIVLENLSSGN